MEKDIMMWTMTLCCGDSLRDREAKRLIEENTAVTKDGKWWTVRLFGREVRVYCNTKNLYPKAYDLLLNNPVWGIAKKNVKAQFVQKGERK